MRSFGPCRSAISASGRPAVLLRRAHETRALGVGLVRAVREVQACAVHPRLDERGDALGVELAGPIVATILVRRGMTATGSKRYRRKRGKAAQPG